jgi:hypothetical protein
MSTASVRLGVRGGAALASMSPDSVVAGPSPTRESHYATLALSGPGGAPAYAAPIKALAGTVTIERTGGDCQ